MWIFTRYGFFSAVCARQGNGKHGHPVDPNRIMVRSRLRSHLVALQKRFRSLLVSSEIQESVRTDYAFRLFVDKPVWVQILADLAEETDYDNFKSAVVEHQGPAGSDYENSLHKVWSILRELQTDAQSPQISNERIDAITPFLDRFETAGYSEGAWHTAPGEMPYFDYDSAVSEFCQFLHDNGWVDSGFDWGKWQASAEEFAIKPQKIASADAITIQKLFTTHVRKDRFCEGHLAAMFKSGHVVALLRRLKSIGEESRQEHEPSSATLGGKAATMNSPENPWVHLPHESPLVLTQDAKLIEQFNVRAKDEFKIHLEIFPEPFVGNPNAAVVLLGLNPGFKQIDLRHHSDERFAALSRANLMHELKDYPFYLLDPTIERTKYWEKTLRRLTERFDAAFIAREVLCVEYFPYHSQKFRHGKLKLPSQRYSFSLVLRAIKRGAVILQLRGNRHWLAAVPELATYSQLYRPRSVQNPTVSARNFPEGFAAAMVVLEKEKGSSAIV